MNNPLWIVWMIISARRPSDTYDMPAVSMPFWIRRGFQGMTFFGHIITPDAEEARHFNHHWDELKNHEMIHLFQARSTHNSWLCFYILYIWYWLRARHYNRYISNAGYWLNPFEMEAYENMYRMDYLHQRLTATGWKRYAALPLEERLRLLTGRD